MEDAAISMGWYVCAEIWTRELAMASVSHSVKRGRTMVILSGSGICRWKQSFRTISWQYQHNVYSSAGVAKIAYIGNAKLSIFIYFVLPRKQHNTSKKIIIWSLFGDVQINSELWISLMFGFVGTQGIF